MRPPTLCGIMTAGHRPLEGHQRAVRRGCRHRHDVPGPSDRAPRVRFSRDEPGGAREAGEVTRRWWFGVGAIHLHRDNHEESP